MTIEIPDQPEGFSSLCEMTGLAMMLGQKVQYALAGYFAIYSGAKLGATADAVKAQMTSHLSKPMGAVIGDIEKRAPLPSEIWKKVQSFRDERNWLVHDFDEEATPHLAAGEKIPDYTARMESIAQAALELMQLLDGVGKDLAGV